MMKSWFTKQPSKFSKKGEDGFFDCGDDRDPWTSSSIDFFNSSKNLKKKSDKAREEYPEGREISELGPISFPKLNASYEEIRKERIRNQPFQEDHLSVMGPSLAGASSTRPTGQAFLQNDSPVRADPSYPSIPTFSAQAPSSFKLMDPKQRLFDVAGVNPTHFDPEVKKDTISDERPRTHELKNREEFSEDLSIRQNSLTHPPKEPSKGIEESWDAEEDRDRPSVFKIVIASTGLFFVAGMLWLISNQNTYNEDEDLPVIEAPQTIKVKPDKKKSPLVPYQDELIYGKLEEVDEDVKEEGERILPPTDFAPEPPGIEGKETQGEDAEYLEYGKAPQKEAESEPEEEIMDIRRESPKSIKPFQSLEKSIPEEKQSRAPLTKQTPKVEKKEEQAPKKPALPEAARTLYFIQLGTLPTKAIATAEIRRLRAKYKLLSSYGMTIRQSQTPQGEKNYRILAGPFLSKAKASQMSQKLGSRYRVIG